LTRRANQAQIHIIEKIIEPAPQERQRVFHFLATMFARSVSICRIGFAAFSLKFDTSGKSPAHCHHREIEMSPRGANPPRAFCLRTPPIGRRPVRQDASLVLHASSPSRRRPNSFDSFSEQPARANVPAGSAPVARARGPLTRTGVAPEMIALIAIMPRSQFMA
jgi:hypothetical protein